MVVLFFFFKTGININIVFLTDNTEGEVPQSTFHETKKCWNRKLKKKRKILNDQIVWTFYWKQKERKKKKLALLCHTEPEGYNVNAHIFLTCQHTI